MLNGKKLGRWASAGVGFVVMFVMEMWHGFTLPYIVGGVYNGLLLGGENLLGLTTADKRKMKKPIYVARCIIVNGLFALNTILMTVPQDKLLEIIKGFIRL